MNARFLSIAAALVLSAVSAGAFAQSSQDMTPDQQQASAQTAPAQHHRFYSYVTSHVTQAHNQSLYRGH